MTRGESERHVRQLLDTAAAAAPMLAGAVLAWRREDALAEARRWDAAALAAEATAPPLAGCALSVKACVDVAGWVTHAGSRVLADAAPAAADAPVVAALRDAGAVVLAQTNMTEFAYSGLGLNPHYGTPRSPVYAGGDRIAGGSSSGAAVTVAVGAVDAALGTDTSGSVRIPAAFCGVVGFKPSAGRYPIAGTIPLAPSFDVPGFIARSAAECDRLDAALTRRVHPAPRLSVRGARLLVPRGFLAGRVDDVVATAVEATVRRLASLGARVEERDMAYLAEIGEASRDGGMVAAESYDWHEPLLARRAALYDPRVGPRIAAGARVRAVDYVRARRRLRDLALRYAADLEGADALLTPTVPLEPPALADLADDDRYLAVNGRVLYCTELANRVDVPSISLPVGGPECAVGLLLTGRRGEDAALLSLARAVETALRTRTSP